MKNLWIKLWKNMGTVQFHMFSHMFFTPFSQGQSACWGKKLKIQMPYPRANKDNHMPCLSTPLPPLIDVSEVEIIFRLKFFNQGWFSASFVSHP